MRRTRKKSAFSLMYKPLCIAILLIGVFGLVWLRSSVTASSYALRGLEDKRSYELKEMKTLLAERARLMALTNLELPAQGEPRAEKKLVSGGYVFPDRIKVIHVQRAGGPDVRRASYQPVERR